MESRLGNQYAAYRLSSLVTSKATLVLSARYAYAYIPLILWGDTWQRSFNTWPRTESERQR